MRPSLNPQPSTLNHCAAVFVLALLGVPSAVVAQGASNENATLEAIERAEQSVVSIARITQAQAAGNKDRFQVDPRVRFQPNLPRTDPNDPLNPEFVPNEFGTGIVFAPRHARQLRLVLTNYHVVKGGRISSTAFEVNRTRDRLFVRFSDRTGCDATILAADPRSDLAVLELKTEGSRVDVRKLQPLRIRKVGLRRNDANRLRKGHEVILLGNPYAIARDGSASVARGFLSNILREPAPIAEPTDEEARNHETIHQFGTLLQIDARINLGASGGAVLNSEGELIGLATAMAALQRFETPAGYAIPFDDLTVRAVEALSKGYEVEYGLLGIQPGSVFGSSMPAEVAQPSAATVAGVHANSPAAVAGLRRGDIILSVNGQPLYSRNDLMREVGRLEPQSSCEVLVHRLGGQRKFTVKLAKWPVRNTEDLIVTQFRHGPWDLGPNRSVIVDFSTARQKHFDRTRYHNAVVVTHVRQTSDAQATTLYAGEFISHVNGVVVSTPAEFARQIRKHAGETVELKLPARVVRCSVPAGVVQ